MFLLVGGLLLLLTPEAEIRKFVRLVLSLLLIALAIQPLAGGGTGILFDKLREPRWIEITEPASMPGESEIWQNKAERLLQRGSEVVMEQASRQASQQIGALLGFFTGVKQAQVVTQITPAGEVERVIVHLQLSESDSDDNQLSLKQDNGKQVELVQPVMVSHDHETAGTFLVDSSKEDFVSPVVSRVRKWVAAFYGLDEDEVKVTTSR